MRTKTEIQHQLKLFKQKYEGKDPAILGITAAVQRGYLYGNNTNHKQIRLYWADLLMKCGAKYTIKSSPKDLMELFIKDIADIKSQMNKQFPNSFANAKQDYDNEFRLAHAQKSLSIYLKHLWSRNQLGGNLPPVCPIDGIILKSIGINDPWTKINTFDTTAPGYNYYLDKLDKAAKQTKDPLAVWELFQWPSQRKKGTKGTTKKCRNKTQNNSLNDSIRPILAGEIVKGRTVNYGYEFDYDGRSYYLMAGKKKTFAYCELLSKGNNDINSFARIQDLEQRGYNIKRRNYIFKKYKIDEMPLAIAEVDSLLKELGLK